MGKHIEQVSDMAMGSIYAWCEYLPIPWDHCITKVKRKASDTLDDYHPHGVIGGCDIIGWV